MTLGRYGQPQGEPPAGFSDRERSLSHAYRHTTGADMPRSARPHVVVEPCACGVDILSISDAPVDIYAAVHAHVQERPHLEWRVRGTPPDPTAPAHVDVSGPGGASGPAGDAA